MTRTEDAAPLENEALETEVLVVGAGPTGLMAALVLARRGVRALVIDSKEGPTRESRALVVHARSMEIYDQLGLAQQVLDGAVPGTGIQIRGDRREFGAIHEKSGATEAEPGSTGRASRINIDQAQEGWTPFPGVQIFEQSRNEELLARTLATEGHPVLWQHGLESLASDADSPDAGVEAMVTGPDGPLRIRARWCIGADGAGSAVRHQLSLPFEGVTDDATFCVADVHGVTGLPENLLVAQFGNEKFAILFPLGPGGHKRLIWLHGEEHPDQETALTEARTDLGIDYDSVDWFSAYRVHHRVASTFHQGAVFLAGDAAHVHSPLGGQGMNTGLQDAHHLAHLLADVLSGHRSESALARYELERRPVALTLIEWTDQAFGMIARPGRGTAFLRRRARDVMAVLAPRLLSTRLGPYVGGLLGQYRIRYHAVPKGEQPPRWAADPAVGLRLPPTRENAEGLRAMSWQLHTYGTDADRPVAVPDWVEGPFAFSPDPWGRLRRDRLYLVRPDGFVAASFPLHAGAAAVHEVREALHAHDVVG
ncbi:2-polyprenyl-6-methoxyphenol hydroxylase [Brachybacterium alimentarium]|uniref:FAD-dependent monooxygenase n=1 Tax=Brachybacterium alimentarium TaxID=47845 RepID=UPI000DF3A8B6|nr:FAD-dependent monooxygenase [Brachybacterium alimentarium]RCS77100.1 2-polyprenyl-6-methoxyphenol hydroxylase [Brachybacterium alimentarium]